ncbi:MAG: hypothetical protein WC584_01540 [Candidatus Pacearchaeota archaeon]
MDNKNTMRINKKPKIGIAILIGIVLFINSVFAFAVSSAYWQDNPLKIMPGETKEIKIVLQNMAGTENITLKGKISEGDDIAKIIDSNDIYEIPLGTKKEINIKVTIPEDYKVGENYTIKASFTTVTMGGGSFGFGSSIDKTIPILIVNSKGEFKKEIFGMAPAVFYSIIIILALLIVLIIIFLIIRRRKNNQKFKRR